MQTDLKRVLAYSTVSQLGYMMLGLGVGAPGAAVFHLFTHAFFKACLFLAAGNVIHALSGEQDIRKMGGLFGHMPRTALAFWAAVLAIAGCPPLSGFFSKDAILWYTWTSGHDLLYVTALLTSGLTALYMVRLAVAVFSGTPQPATSGHAPHDAPLSMLLPVLLLAVLSTVSGWLNIPAALGGHHWFETTLALPHLTGETASPDTERSFTLFSSLWAIAWISVGFYLFTRAHGLRLRIAATVEPIRRVLYNAYHIDQLYGAVLVRPLARFSDGFLARIAELRLIDGGLIAGGPRLIASGARMISRLQRGAPATLAFYFLLGFIMIMAVFFGDGNAK